MPNNNNEKPVRPEKKEVWMTTGNELNGFKAEVYNQACQDWERFISANLPDEDELKKMIRESTERGQLNETWFIRALTERLAVLRGDNVSLEVK